MKIEDANHLDPRIQKALDACLVHEPILGSKPREWTLGRVPDEMKSQLPDHVDIHKTLMIILPFRSMTNAAAIALAKTLLQVSAFDLVFIGVWQTITVIPGSTHYYPVVTVFRPKKTELGEPQTSDPDVEARQHSEDSE